MECMKKIANITEKSLKMDFYCVLLVVAVYFSIPFHCMIKKKFLNSIPTVLEQVSQSMLLCAIYSSSLLLFQLLFASLLITFGILCGLIYLEWPVNILHLFWYLTANEPSRLLHPHHFTYDQCNLNYFHNYYFVFLLPFDAI